MSWEYGETKLIGFGNTLLENPVVITKPIHGLRYFYMCFPPKRRKGFFTKVNIKHALVQINNSKKFKIIKFISNER